MIRSILFDVDQTLLDYHASEALAVTRFFASHGFCADAAAIARASTLSWHYWDELRLSDTHLPDVQAHWTENYRLAVFRFIEQLKVEYALPASATAEEYMDIFSHCSVPFPDTVSTLSALSKDFSLCAASNGLTACQTSRLSQLPFFSRLFISEDIGFVKPNTGFFRKALDLTGIPAEETLMVGDSLQSDIEGALAAGIHTLRLNRNGSENKTSIVPEGEIHSLAELISHPVLQRG